MRTSAHGGRRLVGRTRYARVVAMSEPLPNCGGSLSATPRPARAMKGWR